MTVWKVVVTGVGGGFVPLGGRERVGETYVGDDELRFEVDMGDESTEVEREKRREVERGRSLGAGRSFSPLTQKPGPRQELGRRKKNSQHVGSHPSHRANVSYSSCMH